MILYEVFEKGSILNPMIKSSFGRRGRAESLDCDLQRSFLAFFFLNLYETGRLVGARVALVPFPQVKWGSGKVVSLEDGPLLERSECSRWISKCLLFASSCLSTGGFSPVHCENLVGFQKVKIMKVGGPMTGSLGVDFQFFCFLLAGSTGVKIPSSLHVRV